MAHNIDLLPFVAGGAIKYSVGMDYSISWNKTVLGNEPTFDYPGYLAGDSRYTGYRSWIDNDVYGFRTWKHTSGGDGMLRTQADIDNYWNYLTSLLPHIRILWMSVAMP